MFHSLPIHHDPQPLNSWAAHCLSVPSFRERWSMRSKREVQHFIVASRYLYQYLAQGKALCAQDMEIVTCCLDELASAAKRAMQTGRQSILKQRVNDGLVHSQDIDQLGYIPPVRILLVDDHKLVRESLRAFLELYPELEVVGEASNGEEALQAVRRLMPTVVVMDVNMPRLNGIEATRRIKSAYPHIVIVGLSMHADQQHCTAMKAAGASSLVMKETIVDHLHAEIMASLNRRSSAIH